MKFRWETEFKNIAMKREKVRRRLKELLIIDDFEELRIKTWTRKY